MADQTEGGSKEFQAFLKSAPALDDATSEEVTVLSGMVFRSEDGKFALTTGDGQTYDIETSAVQRFKVVDSSGLSPVVTLQLSREALNKATLRPIKPIIKDVLKDIIKDIIQDHKHIPKDVIGDPKVPWKDIHKDPIHDTYKETPKDPIHDTIKELPKDPIRDTYKEVPKDPIRDTYKEIRKELIKDIHKDPIRDPVGTLVWDELDPGGTGVADTAVEGIDQFDPNQGLVNPAGGMAAGNFGQAGFGGGGDMTPFIMATPHHAPEYMVAQQMGAQPGMQMQGGQMQGGFAGAGITPNLKPFQYDTIKELQYETVFHFDRPHTRKEMIFDTRKEMIWDTWVEQGPHTWQENTFDPGGQVIQPQVWGFPGMMM